MGQTINQVRHFYFAKKLGSGTNLLASDAAGTILPKGDTAKTHMYFQYMSPGGIVRSDLIKVNKVMSIKATASDEMAHKLKRVLITLDNTVSDTPVAGQEYIIRVAFRQYIGFSEEDQYQKYASATATNGMTASDLYKALAVSLFKNAKADKWNKLITVYLDASGTPTELTEETKETDLTGTYTGIIVEEVEQAWERGMMPQGFIPFDIQFKPITVDGDEFIWGQATPSGATPVGTDDYDSEVEFGDAVINGKNIADLEYFCMGARGDMYRMMGYPNIIKTTYLVDPDKEYDTLDIHYAFTDSNESVQKSEKDITIVCENDGSHTDMNALIAKVNALLPDELQIDTL
jgi:hypothetical protein